MLFCRQSAIFFIVLAFLNGAESLNCYDCPGNTPGCTNTCTGATTCAYQISMPMLPTYMQMSRCERNITVQGCMGSLDTQIFVCYCTWNMCNLNINTTLTPVSTMPTSMSSAMTTPLMGSTPRAGMPNMMPGMTPGLPNLMPGMTPGLPHLMPGQQMGMTPGLPNMMSGQQMGMTPGMPNMMSGHQQPGMNNVMPGQQQPGMMPYTTPYPAGKRRRRNIDMLAKKFNRQSK